MFRRVLLVVGIMCVAGSADAATKVYKTARTKEAAMKAATLAARHKAKVRGKCYKTAWVINECSKHNNRFTCRADASDTYGACQRHNWLDPNGPVPFYSVPVAKF